jgi:outer membrane lipoprotein LolB
VSSCIARVGVDRVRLVHLVLLFVVSALVLISGCVSVPSNRPELLKPSEIWAGRLAIRVEDQPSQSFSTSFELKGSAQLGELSLFSPIGSTLALLAWQPGRASLHTPSGQRDFASIDDLIVKATGTAIPVLALFDWLDGRATPVAGWQLDLSEMANGRLTARKAAPATELRLILAPR